MDRADERLEKATGKTGNRRYPSWRYVCTGSFSSGNHQTCPSIGLGIETVYDDEIWMGWTIFESGNVGYGQVGGDGGRAYGRYQFDYQYALPEFLAYAVSADPEKYSMLSKYTRYGAGSDKLFGGRLGNGLPC